ncbi:MAG: GDSL-type esterase/lipase family protein [Bacteroidota bacterium]
MDLDNAGLFHRPISFLGLNLLCLFICCNSPRDKIRISCVGDSITFGARLEDPEKDSYPAQLQDLLGPNYQVTNHGISSLTLLKKGTPNVWGKLLEITEAEPNMVIISLGTNDTCGMGTCGERKCWEFKDEFFDDYGNLIDALKKLPSQPDIWVCAPTPMVLETPGLPPERIKGLAIRKPRLKAYIADIKKVANEKRVRFINLNTPLQHRPELFTEKDGVHPNKAGYLAIAQLVYAQLKP